MVDKDSIYLGLLLLLAHNGAWNLGNAKYAIYAPKLVLGNINMTLQVQDPSKVAHTGCRHIL